MFSSGSRRPNNSDVEKNLSPLTIALITLRWSNLSYQINGNTIIDGVSGQIDSGQMLAVMGPSGAGKSTFLDVLCRRAKASKGSVRIVLLNGSGYFDTKRTMSFVEQDDALFGVLTVHETVSYAARLSLPRGTPNIKAYVDDTLRSLGLQDVANNIIGTPLQRGISGGQKRRVTIACSVVARPRVLVLDEPTSGLDSGSAREVMASLKRLAQQTSMICIATIHQPNWELFSLFDQLTLLAGGRVMYNGAAGDIDQYLTEIGHPTPHHVNPVDQAINVVNTEFYEGGHGASRLDSISAAWCKLEPKYNPLILDGCGHSSNVATMNSSQSLRNSIHKTRILTQRNFRNYVRNLLAFGIRMGMYVGMGLMLATIWIRLGTGTEKINDRLSVFFFSVAFLGFMSVAGIPAFLEERAVFVRERANGLYGPGAYVLANTIAVIPFLFACTLLFSVIAYWAIGLHPGATAFFRFLLYLFLGVLAAESQSILVAALVPIFVASLALASFMNGFWMCVQGYFIKATSLPRFWYYWAHWIDYQTFAFQLLVRNDSIGLIFQCPHVDGSCLCPFASSLVPEQCALTGDDLIKNLGYEGANDGLYIGILIIIIIVFRTAMWFALVIKKR